MVDKSCVPTYEELLDIVASECEGFSGASIAGVARAAASHALERAVTGFADTAMSKGQSMLDCLVTEEDLALAIDDIVASSGDSDWAEKVEATTSQATAGEGPTGGKHSEKERMNLD